MEDIRVTNIKEDNDNDPIGLTVTLTRVDGKKFTVNIPNTAWGTMIGHTG